MPYLYTAFHTYEQQGVPPFRAMVLEKGFESTTKKVGGTLDDVKNPYAEQALLEVTDQYMMGPSILVAPVFTGETERKVVLPAGNWYDFYSGALVGNGETITIQPTLDKIPLFVKDGALIPMLSTLDVEDTDQTLEVRYYGTKPGSFRLYNDDGNSFDYESGEFTITDLAVSVKKNKLKGTQKVSNDLGYGYKQVEWVWIGR